MKNFPTRAPVGMLLGVVLGLFSVVPVFVAWHRSQPPLERFYFPQYIGSTLAQTPVGTVTSFFRSRRGTRTYFVLMEGDRPITNAALPGPAGRISIRVVQTTPRIFGTWLRNHIYGGRAFREVLQVPLVAWIGTFFILFAAGVVWDFLRRKRAREGVKLRGPDLLSRSEFNQATNGDGFTLYVRD
jgi:hypothetical protein